MFTGAGFDTPVHVILARTRAYRWQYGAKAGPFRGLEGWEPPSKGASNTWGYKGGVCAGCGKGVKRVFEGGVGTLLEGVSEGCRKEPCQASFTSPG